MTITFHLQDDGTIIIHDETYKTPEYYTTIQKLYDACEQILRRGKVAHKKMN